MRENYIRPPGKIKLAGASGAAHFACCLALVVFGGLVALGGCAAGPRLESLTAPALPSVTLTEAGVQFTLFPNTWSAYPGDLARSYTPLEVKIENARAEELQVRYEDFAILDDARQQYRAVPPGDVARSLYGAIGPVTPSPGARPLLAGPWYPYGPHYWGPYYGPYWPWWYADPYYAPYGWPRPYAEEILTRALREGPVLPGASIQGFLYFQLATSRGTSLTVSWTPRLAGGAPTATFSAPFRIVR